MTDYLAVPIGEHAPGIVAAVIDTPRRKITKYVRHQHDFHPAKPIYSPIHFPGSYGFIPHTAGADGDPLSFLLLDDRRLFLTVSLKSVPSAFWNCRSKAFIAQGLWRVILAIHALFECGTTRMLNQILPWLSSIFFLFTELPRAKEHEFWAGDAGDLLAVAFGPVMPASSRELPELVAIGRRLKIRIPAEFRVVFGLQTGEAEFRLPPVRDFKLIAE